MVHVAEVALSVMFAGQLQLALQFVPAWQKKYHGNKAQGQAFGNAVRKCTQQSLWHEVVNERGW